MLDFSHFTEREGNDSQRLVRVEKVRQKWRESGLVLEQTDLKAIGQDWRSWSVEGGEKEVARWIKENAAIFEGGLVMGYPEWICHICDQRSGEPLSCATRLWRFLKKIVDAKYLSIMIYLVSTGSTMGIMPEVLHLKGNIISLLMVFSLFHLLTVDEKRVTVSKTGVVPIIPLVLSPLYFHQVLLWRSSVVHFFLSKNCLAPHRLF